MGNARSKKRSKKARQAQRQTTRPANGTSGNNVNDVDNGDDPFAPLGPARLPASAAQSGDTDATAESRAPGWNPFGVFDFMNVRRLSFDIEYERLFGPEPSGNDVTGCGNPNSSSDHAHFSASTAQPGNIDAAAADNSGADAEADPTLDNTFDLTDMAKALAEIGVEKTAEISGADSKTNPAPDNTFDLTDMTKALAEIEVKETAEIKVEEKTGSLPSLVADQGSSVDLISLDAPVTPEDSVDFDSYFEYRPYRNSLTSEYMRWMVFESTSSDYDDNSRDDRVEEELISREIPFGSQSIGASFPLTTQTLAEWNSVKPAFGSPPASATYETYGTTAPRARINHGRMNMVEPWREDVLLLPPDPPPSAIYWGERPTNLETYSDAETDSD